MITDWMHLVLIWTFSYIYIPFFINNSFFFVNVNRLRVINILGMSSIKDPYLTLKYCNRLVCTVNLLHLQHLNYYLQEHLDEHLAQMSDASQTERDQFVAIHSSESEFSKMKIHDLRQVTFCAESRMWTFTQLCYYEYTNESIIWVAWVPAP